MIYVMCYVLCLCFVSFAWRVCCVCFGFVWFLGVLLGFWVWVILWVRGSSSEHLFYATFSLCIGIDFGLTISSSTFFLSISEKNSFDIVVESVLSRP